MPTRPAGTSPYLDKSLKSETHVQEIPGEQSACPRQTGACPLSQKEFASDAPSTLEWRARWRFFPMVPACRRWSTGAPDAAGHQESPASRNSSTWKQGCNREWCHPVDFFPPEIPAAAAYPGCGSSENVSPFVAQTDVRFPLQPPHSVAAAG